MKNKKFLGFILIFLVCLFIDTLGITAHAASATIDFETGSTVVSKGNTVTVSLTIEAEETIGEFEGMISYDPEILEFVEGGSFISGGEGILRVSDTDATEAVTKKKYTMKFKSKKVGISEINLSDKPMIYDFEEGKEMSVSSNRITINVKAAKRVSTDTNLSDLKISPGTISPVFDSKVYEYAASVDSDVTKLIVSAVTKESEASVKVKGNENLIEGKNTITLTVTAPSGDTKEYTILVDKEAVKEDDKTDSSEDISSFNVYEEDGKKFMVNGYRYQIIDVPEDIEVPVGYAKTKLILYGINVSAYTLTNDLENDFLLVYAMNEEGTSNFYQYDRVEKTLQRYTGPMMSADTNNSDKDVTSKEYSEKLSQLSIIIAVLSALSALLSIGIIRLYLKTKGYKDDYLE